jgi:hypothetical protein
VSPSNSALAAFILASALVASTATHAQMLKDGPPPEDRLVYNSLAIARVNPIGGVEFLRLTYRKRLYLAQELALRDNYVGGGLSTAITPAYAKLGALVETQPLTMLRLWAQFEIAGYYSTFSMVQSVPDVRDDFSDTELRRRAELPVGTIDRNYATVGTHGTLGADFVAKIGPIALRDFMRLTTARLNLRGLDVAYYDLQDDVLAPNGGFVFFNDTDVLYVSDFGLTAGVRFNVSHPFYDARHFGGDVNAANAANPNGPMTRVGPVVAYTFFSEDGAMFNNPTVLLIANWWLTHRFRTGADSSQAFPYIAVGFAFNGDLLPVK